MSERIRPPCPACGHPETPEWHVYNEQGRISACSTLKRRRVASRRQYMFRSQAPDYCEECGRHAQEHIGPWNTCPDHMGIEPNE